VTPRKAKETPDPRVNVVMPPDLHGRFTKALYELKRTKKGDTSNTVCEAVDAWLQKHGY
jgi:hypothetical protein